MPNIANVLKAEISRIARKEVKSETAQVKKVTATYRHQIATLRKKIDSLERQVRRVRKGSAKPIPDGDPAPGEFGKRLRFSAARFASLRQKLGLSAAEMGTLLGVSGQSVYKWEKGEVRPRNSQIQAISKVRGLGKREAAARLAAIGEMK